MELRYDPLCEGAPAQREPKRDAAYYIRPINVCATTPGVNSG